MLSVSALDFINYKNALKGNYRKGLHTFRCILENPTQAENFATNLGGVCVVLGVPIGQDDRNSAELLALLLASDVVDTATLTWMSQWYADYCDDWDTLASDIDRCTTMAETDLMWRSVGAGPVGAAKVIATLAGLACADYADMTELAASQTAMAAVAESPVAVAAIWESDTALEALESDSTAWATFTGASSEVMGKAVAILADLDPADYNDMDAVAASSTAMTAVAASSAARTAITNSATAKTALASSPLKTTVTKGNGNNWETRTIRNGMGWLISCYNANSGGEAGSTWYKLDGVQTSQPAGTTNVEKFFTSSLEIYWWSSTSSVTYIPC